MEESRYGFGAPFVDVDEWRDTPRRHRYVHGGFEDTQTRFSFYFPPADVYRGRFFQQLEGGSGGHETVLASGGMGGFGTAALFDLAFEELGGYLLESNQGHFPNEGGVGFSDEVQAFGASAESARYSRQLAEEMYGSAPHHGYVFGGSAGGIKSISCFENEPDLYDGAVPSIGNTAGVAQQWSVVGYWWLHARHRVGEIVEATSPGGSGNPFEHLTNDQREALAAVYRHGFPRGSEAFLWFSPTWMYNIAGPSSYYEQFWSTPGYLGHDNPESMARVLVDETARVRRVIRLSEMGPDDLMAQFALAAGTPDHNYAVELEDDLDDNTKLFGANLTFLSGQAKGRSLYVNGVRGRAITVTGELTPELFADVEPGDELQIDNHRFVAWCYEHRYQNDLEGCTIDDPVMGERVLAPEYGGIRAWTVDGVPVFPQHPMARRNEALVTTGRFAGKMIYVNGTSDTLMWPIGAATYDRKVRSHLGDGTDDSYRLWWVEHHPHGNAELVGPFLTAEKDPGVWRSRFAAADGVTNQALRDVVRWVEDDVAPPASTSYRFTGDGGLVLPANAAERGGIQPVVTASVDGDDHVEVKVGKVVRLRGVAEQPAGTGSIVWARWDFEGTGSTSFEHEVDGTSERVEVETTHAYAEPGTYFAGFRAGAHRDGTNRRGAAAENLARVRVVVTP